MSGPRWRYFQGIRYVSNAQRIAGGIPANAKAPTTCGHCGRTWDDGHVSGYTPTPSGRCPFEPWHTVQSVQETKNEARKLAHVSQRPEYYGHGNAIEVCNQLRAALQEIERMGKGFGGNSGAMAAIAGRALKAVQS